MNLIGRSCRRLWRWAAFATLATGLVLILLIGAIDARLTRVDGGRDGGGDDWTP